KNWSGKQRVSKRWVVNTSPIVVLSKIDCIHLLADMSEKLIIPHAVANEIEAFLDRDPPREWIEDKGKPLIVDPIPIDPSISDSDLGRGESEVLSHALCDPGLEALIDDRAARDLARRLGIPFRGTIGLLLLAKREGRIETLKPKLMDISEVGLYVDNQILNRALDLAGED
ncbi:MAG: DUF3368 domain-containing protein, partial [Candidatus Omnitrophica bacterium]|nr:DUF3368 domain-containing protein [Candidatus Omnitrophota bacterium]